MEFNEQKHANNERYLSQQQPSKFKKKKLFERVGPETFVELIRVKMGLPDRQTDR